jgi:carbonyl reductase 1
MTNIWKQLSFLFLLFTSNATAMAMKTVLVTGGNRGIGKAICQLLLEQHPDVNVLLGSRNLENGNKAAQDIQHQVGNACEGRLHVVEMDTSSDDSVSKAATEIASQHKSLYAICNNAGVHNGPSHKDVMNTNYFGPRRVNDALINLLQRPGGRIVNIASASGPKFISSMRDQDLRAKLSQPWLITGGLAELDEMAHSLPGGGDSYGISKAFVNAYTRLYAKAEPDLLINSVTPGFIASDMGKMLGATKPVAAGAVPPVYLLMDPELETVPTGRYYGSDSKRSPIDRYRGPGDPVFEGPDWS